MRKGWLYLPAAALFLAAGAGLLPPEVVVGVWFSLLPQPAISAAAHNIVRRDWNLFMVVFWVE